MYNRSDLSVELHCSGIVDPEELVNTGHFGHVVGLSLLLFLQHEKVYRIVLRFCQFKGLHDLKTSLPESRAAKFEIRDKDGKVIETVVTDKDGHAESKELPICIYNEDGSFKEDIHYYVVETKAAEGYILDETVHEVVLQYDDNAPECVEYTLSLTNKPTEPKLPQTGDNFNPWLYAGLGLGALALGLFAAFWKKKEDGAEEA